MTDLEKIIRRADRLRARRGWSETRFGLQCCRNSCILTRLRHGNVTLRTIRRVREWLDQQEALDRT